MPIRALALIALAAGTLAAQDDSVRRVDEIFQEWSKPATPGASVAVIRDGKIVLAKGYGAANLEYDAPVTADTVFHVASVTKQFTGMAIVLLEQDRKLSVEDDIRKYLPELPDYGKPITIRNLLQHTSGIRDQWQTLALAGWRLDDVITQKQILQVLFRQKELNFPPGSEHLYSNGGYTLAAEIVARVSGKSFPQFCEERIFRPLGMKLSHMHDDHKRIVPNRSGTYTKVKDGFEAAPLNYANAGATSLFTTAPDLVRWLDNFREPKVGGRAGVDRLQEQAVLTDGKKIDYALGVSIGRLRGLRTVSHAGGDAGYRSYVVWFPDHKLGVAVLSGLGSFNPGGVANKVAAVYLGDSMEPEKEQPKRASRQYIEVDPATLDRFTGIYRLGPGLSVQVEKRSGKLYAAPVGQTMDELKPLAANRFYAERPNAELEFTPVETGMSVTLRQGPGTMKGEKVTEEPAGTVDLAQFSGTYWSDELETQYIVRLREGKLIADHVRHGEIPLTPTFKDRFGAGQWFMQEIRFSRDGSGRVSGMTVGGGRVKGVKFVRLSSPNGTRP